MLTDTANASAEALNAVAVISARLFRSDSFPAYKIRRVSV
jgi:hypothetical protein